MEAVAFLEVLGRDGRIAARQPVRAFPCRVGRRRVCPNHTVSSWTSRPTYSSASLLHETLSAS